MKKIKSIVALLLALMLVFSLTGCHKQNEIAVTVGDMEFTSAMYSYALLNADSEAQQLVLTQLGIDAYSTEAANVNFYSQAIEGVAYVDWVENRAVELIKEYAAYMTLCQQNNVVLDKNTLDAIESYASNDYASNEDFYKNNGIGLETVKKWTALNYYIEKYFSFLYGKEGSKAIADEEIKKVFSNSYRVVVYFEEDITDLKGDDLTKVKDKMEGYKKTLATKNEKDIVALYNKVYNLTEENISTTGRFPATKISECINIISDPEVNKNSTAVFWEDIKNLAVGEVKLWEDEENGKKYLCLIYIVDPFSSEDYLNNTDLSIRWNLKNEEYTAEMETYAKGLTAETHKYAISDFKVKNIYYGE